MVSKPKMIESFITKINIVDPEQNVQELLK